MFTFAVSQQYLLIISSLTTTHKTSDTHKILSSEHDRDQSFVVTD